MITDMASYLRFFEGSAESIGDLQATQRARYRG